MLLQTIKDYRNIQLGIAKLIDASGMRVSFIIEKLGMDRTSFYHKRKLAKFTVDELEKLLVIIRADDLEDKVLLQLSEESKLRNDYIEVT